jgi:ADAM-TS Spacer 1
VGCDWIVDSNTTEDQCGVCGGHGESCTTIKGEFVKKINLTEGYFEIVLIPSGSRHIVVEEMGPSKNFLGVGKADSKDFYLNGDRLISMSGEYDVAGSLGLYERDNELEKLKIPGPIKEDISLYVSHFNPDSDCRRDNSTLLHFADCVQGKAQEPRHPL